ncbi:hypothetical protein [Herbaspirillum sp. ST 5-3]|uniref:hypothetical protein n=1 Tax=Oxalobacteraceae TaxID=75682 RepID=UPI0010A42ABC|nr:hypothetical protein [Herbaspirillum sp. ST 5-3]
MKWQKTRHARMIPLALTGLLLAGQAQTAETPAQKREKQLQERLARSDAQAAALQKRIEQLEKQVAALRGTIAHPAVASAPTSAKPAAATVAQATPSAPPPRAASAQSSGGSSTARSAPGKFEVDEEAAQRALERTLTQSGALLLPPRTIELTPSYSYRRTEVSNSVPATITTATSPTPTVVLANQRTRRNENIARLDLRAGLPYQSQLEFSLPYNYVRSSQTTDLGGTTSANGSGIGDVTLGLAKTLTRESGWRPDLIGRLSYNFGNGRRTDNNVALLGGYRQLQAEVLALKRQDPLAFFASAFYGKTWEKDGVKPGDVAGLSLSSVLAASPATSLQFGFSQIYRKDQELNGAKVAGSNQTYGLINLGASSVLSRDMTLVTQFGIGLGNDAPKYNFTISLPILFR